MIFVAPGRRRRRQIGPGTGGPATLRKARKLAISSASPATMPERRPGKPERLDSE